MSKRSNQETVPVSRFVGVGDPRRGLVKGAWRQDLIVAKNLFSTEVWLTPIILLPGVALLIVSTSARIGQIHSEVHWLLGGVINIWRPKSLWLVGSLTILGIGIRRWARRFTTPVTRRRPKQATVNQFGRRFLATRANVLPLPPTL